MESCWNLAPGILVWFQNMRGSLISEKMILHPIPRKGSLGWVLARLTMLWWFFQEYEQFIWLGSGLPKSRLRILKNLIISNLQNGIYNTRTGLWILFLLKVYLPWLPFARLSTELMPKQAVSGSIQFLKWAALEKGWKLVCQDCPFMFLLDRCLMSLWNAAGLCIVSWELLKVC